MKPLYLFWAILCPLCTILLFGSNTYGQCPNQRPEQTISYDTSLSGSGSDEYILNFPQFDPALGTLTKVKFETIVTLIYSLRLESNDATNSFQKVRVSRTDEITYPWAQVGKTLNKILGPYALAGTDGVTGSGPDYIEDGPLFIFRDSLNTYNITDNVAAFLGNGSVELAYNTYSFASGNLNSTLRGEAQDFATFRITYTYCSTSFLAVDVMQFNATKLSTGDIQLSWVSPNDRTGTKYDVEKSADGKAFTRVQSLITGNVPSANKQVFYHPANDDKNKIFFRIRQFEADGSSNYSAIRQITLDPDESSMKVYPTIASNVVNIYFPPKVRGDYRVSIISTTGQVMQQSEFSRTNYLRMPFIRKLSPGMYIVSVFNKKTMESRQSKIVVQ